MVAMDWNVAICDFGVSRMVDSLNMTRGVGTPLYTAPEVLEGTQYSLSADVYSYSICIWQLLNGVEPYVGINYMHLVSKIVTEKLRPPVQPQDRYAPLLEACWQVEADARPKFEEIVQELKGFRRHLHVGAVVGAAADIGARGGADPVASSGSHLAETAASAAPAAPAASAAGVSAGPGTPAAGFGAGSSARASSSGSGLLPTASLRPPATSPSVFAARKPSLAASSPSSAGASPPSPAQDDPHQRAPMLGKARSPRPHYLLAIKERWSSSLRKSQSGGMDEFSDEEEEDLSDDPLPRSAPASTVRSTPTRK
jgi:serine/threonine protein kinase